MPMHIHTSAAHESVDRSCTCRHNDDVWQAISDLERDLERLLARYRPRLSFIMALDGPAPFAKMQTQRQRRLQKGQAKQQRGGGGLNVLAVTPGTMLIDAVDVALMDWARCRSNRDFRVTFDPSSNPGEGEVKLLGLVRTTSSPEHTHLLIGADSDLLLLAVSSPMPRFFVQVAMLRRRPYCACRDPSCRWPYCTGGPCCECRDSLCRTRKSGMCSRAHGSGSCCSLRSGTRAGLEAARRRRSGRRTPSSISCCSACSAGTTTSRS